MEEESPDSIRIKEEWVWAESPLIEERGQRTYSMIAVPTRDIDDDDEQLAEDEPHLPSLSTSGRTTSEVLALESSHRFWIRLLAVLVCVLFVDVIVMSIYVFDSNHSVRGWGFMNSKGKIDTSGSTIESAHVNQTSLVTINERGNTVMKWKSLPDSQQTLTTIAFGSCSSQHVPLPYWDTLVSSPKQPDLVLLMGDNVYGDCVESWSSSSSSSCPELVQAYADFARHASVQGAALELAVMATLDDHDYGLNDCHGDNPRKHVARQAFADFFRLDAESDLPPDGVYRSAMWGPPGQRLQVILLDARFNRSPFLVDESKDFLQYRPPETAEELEKDQVMLGERQWNWLQDKLLNQKADLRVIVSSIQVLNDVSGGECWRHLPRERERLYQLLGQAKVASSVVLLSGDRHVGGFYQTDERDLIEVTASAWTHSIPVGAFIYKNNCSTAAECDEVDPRRIGPFVRENQYGTMEIDWSNRTMTIALRRAESTTGIVYQGPKYHSLLTSDAGEILLAHTYNFR